MNLLPLYNAFKKISKSLRENDVVDLGNDTQSVNSTMDVQKPIDIISNDALKYAAHQITEIMGVISEEDNEFIIYKPGMKRGYVLIFDPLDGSKNVYSNITVGTIYGIYEYDAIEDVIVSIYETGYCLYGPSTILVRTMKNEKVQQFHLDETNKFVLMRDLELNKKSSVCSVNMAYSLDNETEKLSKKLLLEENCTQRWCGAMVTDCHQVIMRGGTFIYPGTKKNPNGKIRLLYEAIPMAHLFHVLGGCEIDASNESLLRKVKGFKLKQGQSIHIATPIILSTVHEKEYFQR